MKVIKFGGSSLATVSQFEKVIAIITADKERRVIVTSAPGRRFSGDTKVTDLLINYAHQTMAKKDTTAIVNAIFARYHEIGQHFGVSEEELNDIKQILLKLPDADYPTDDYLLATFKAHGERLNARLMALVLNHQGIKARFVDPSEAGIVVTGEPNNADVNPETYDNLDQFQYSDDERLVFPGFFGFTPAGRIATFARGGSDITGAILARGLHADLYENFTDVDAIYSANPRLIKNPAPISAMTYREMRELSYAGFSVFNDEALLPAIQGQIPINVKNTNDPTKEGTMIVPEKGFKPRRIVTGIASKKHFAAIYLHKYLLNRDVGFTLRILQVLDEYNVPYEHMPSGIDDLTIIIDSRKITDDVVDKVCSAVQKEINPDRLEWIDDYAITMVVGEGMEHRRGVSSSILKAVADAGISLSMINQGASQISIMLGTRRKDADAAVKAIYHAFLPQPKQDYPLTTTRREHI